VESYNQAIRLKPDYAEAWSNRGLALQELKQLEAALESYNKSIEIDPDYADAYSGRGNVLLEFKQWEEAVASYDQAIAVKPDYANNYWNKSLALLSGGKYLEGWELYEWRWKKKEFTSPKRNFSEPLWLGNESIAGKTILLHSEQGLGDTIQFCRYVKLVADLGARIIFEVESTLIGLLRQFYDISEFIAKGDPLPPFDTHCPLMSLPLAFKTTIETIPFASKYLSGDPERVAEWSSRLGEKSGPRIGLAWSGSAIHKNDRNRSILLSAMMRHLPPEFKYVSLQKEFREVDKATLESMKNIAHYGDQLGDFADTAALCELMDVVISVDTSVAHLSGAMGKPTWVMLPYSSDWRWLFDRSDSPWYESARLYRQEKAVDWQGVLARVSADLSRQFL